MRLFVGIDLPASLRDRVATQMASVRRALPPAKWTAPEAYHVTLSFLGRVEEETLEDLDRCLKTTTRRSTAFLLQLQAAGVFPPSRGPIRVLWIGLADPDPVVALQREIAASLVESGFLEPDDRPYHPHVTLARCKKPWKRSDAKRWLSLVPGPIGSPFEVHSTVLFRSELGPGGARYERLRAFETGDGP